MLIIWNLSLSRPTRDIDFLGIIPNNPENIHKVISEICKIDCNDGVRFNKETIICESIQEQRDYTGIRATFIAEIDKAKIKMQVDIGFGDVIHPDPIEFEYPTLLNMKHPKIKGYTPETLISEKLHTMFRHATANSRMKDIYDIWLLSRQFPFSGEKLSEAIKKTFYNRGIDLSRQQLKIFNDDFKNDQRKNQLWNAFIEKNALTVKPDNFIHAINQLELFVAPILESYKNPKHFNQNWQPPGPWAEIKV